MKKALLLSLLVLLLIGALFAATGCEVKTEKNDKIFSTEKSTTKCGLGGCNTEKKTCPFWNRKC